MWAGGGLEHTCTHPPTHTQTPPNIWGKNKVQRPFLPIPQPWNVITPPPVPGPKASCRCTDPRDRPLCYQPPARPCGGLSELLSHLRGQPGGLGSVLWAPSTQPVSGALGLLSVRHYSGGIPCSFLEPRGFMEEPPGPPWGGGK